MDDRLRRLQREMATDPDARAEYENLVQKERSYTGDTRRRKDYAEFTEKGEPTGIEVCIDPCNDYYKVSLIFDATEHRPNPAIDQRFNAANAQAVLQKVEAIDHVTVSEYNADGASRQTYFVHDDNSLTKVVSALTKGFDVDKDVEVSTHLYLDQIPEGYAPTPKTRQELKQDPVFHILKQLIEYHSEEAYLWRSPCDRNDKVAQIAEKSRDVATSVMNRLRKGLVDDFEREEIIHNLLARYPEYEQPTILSDNRRKVLIRNSLLPHSEMSSFDLHNSSHDEINLIVNQRMQTPTGLQNAYKIAEQCQYELQYTTEVSSVAQKDWSAEFQERDQRIADRVRKDAERLRRLYSKS